MTPDSAPQLPAPVANTAPAVNIDLIRKQFPQYNDMSDTDLANALHSKYYSDLPIAQFMAKIGMGTASKDPNDTLLDTVKNELQGAVEGVYDFGQKVVSSALTGASNLPQIGGGTIGQGTGLPQLAQNYEANRQATLQSQQQNNPGGSIGRMVGQIAPTFGIPAVGGEGLIGRLAGNAVMGAGASVANPNSGVGAAGTDAAQGAGLGAILGGAAGVIPGLARGMFAKGLPNAQGLQDLASTAPGFVPTAAQLTGSPTLGALAAGVRNIPLVGSLMNSSGKLQSAALKNYAENLINGGGDITDINKQLIQSVTDHKTNLDSQAGALYDKFHDLATQQGGTIPLTNTALTIQQELAKLGSASQLPGFAATDTIDPALARAQQMQATLKAIGPNGVTPDTLKQMRSLVLNASREAEGPELSLTKNVAGALNSDISNYAQNSGNPQLYNAYRDASQFYKDNIVPFTADKQLKGLISSGYNPDKLFSSFIKPNAPVTAGTLVSNLTPEGQGLLQQHLLSKAYQGATDDLTGTFDPLKFMRNVDKLGTTSDVVFDPQTLQKLQGFANLTKTAAPLISPRSLGGVAGGLALTGLAAEGSKEHPEAALTIGLLAAAAGSPTAGKLLLKAAQTNVGSPAAKRLIAGITGAVMNEESQ